MHTTKFLESKTQKNINNHVFKCASKGDKQHARPTSNGQEKICFIGSNENTQKINIQQLKRLEICKAQGLTPIHTFMINR